MQQVRYEKKIYHPFPNLKNLDNTVSHHDDELLQILLYASHKFSSSVKNKILSPTTEFLELTKRFDKPLF